MSFLQSLVKISPGTLKKNNIGSHPIRISADGGHLVSAIEQSGIFCADDHQYIIPIKFG